VTIPVASSASGTAFGRASALTFSALLAAFRSPEPTPGGSAASALAGAVGASLVAMVAQLPNCRATTAEDLTRLQAAGSRCAALGEHLAALMDQDSEAYEAVRAAYRLPKQTDEENAVRGLRIQEALRVGTEAPLHVMRACGDAIEQAAVVAAFGNRHASSDVQVGLDLLRVATRGAQLNVEVNVGSIDDAAFAGAADAEARRRSSEADTGIAAARARLQER
jgi:methenyltetrahydrofolate cyclohydrolase